MFVIAKAAIRTEVEYCMVENVIEMSGKYIIVSTEKGGQRQVKEEKNRIEGR